MRKNDSYNGARHATEFAGLSVTHIYAVCGTLGNVLFLIFSMFLVIT